MIELSSVLRQAPTLRRMALTSMIALGMASGLVFAHVFFVEPHLRPHKPARAGMISSFDMATPFISPGIQDPRTYAAAQAHLHDEEEVIGICVGGRSRAYLVSAFSGPQHHVLNDLLLGQPVSVTHCDLKNCTRVFTSPQGHQPLDISCAGSLGGGLLLLAPGGVYLQDAPALPYQEFPFTVTSWADWKKTHADTDVYIGKEK